MDEKQTWIDTYLGRYRWYRKIRGGYWYRRTFNDNAYELRLNSYSDYWTRYGGLSNYCRVVDTEYNF